MALSGPCGRSSPAPNKIECVTGYEGGGGHEVPVPLRRVEDDGEGGEEGWERTSDGAYRRSK